MKKFTGTIYQAINIQNNKSYIGKTIRDFGEYKQFHIINAVEKRDLKNNLQGKYFYNAIRKYGADNFKWVILGEIEFYNLEDLNDNLNQAEIESIWLFKSNDKDYGYNLTIGGDGQSGYVWTESQLQTLVLARKQSYIDNPDLSTNHSKCMTEHYKDPKAREKTGNASKKAWESEESRKKSSDSHKQLFIDNPELRQVYSQANIDSWSEERRVEWSAILKEDYETGRRVQKFKGKDKTEVFSDDSLALLSLRSSGRNNPRYIEIKHEFLIMLYFTNIHRDIIMEDYIIKFNEKITIGMYTRFLKALNFPTNCVSKYSSFKAREIYTNFIEENKHKIDWYIENYERLEEEYFENNRRYK